VKSVTTARGSIWRRRAPVWVPALVFFLANLVALAVYPVRFAGRAEVTEEEVTAARQELEALEVRRRDAEAGVASIARARLAVERLYDERFSTERRRLTRMIAEVKELAARSGLEPRSISYPSEEIEDYGLERRSFVFSVTGTYSDLRKFINLLELSDSFLTLQSVSLSEVGGVGGEGRLTIQLQLSTLFATEEAPLPTAPRRAGGPAANGAGAGPADAGQGAEGLEGEL
jgi:Tfp pilus assembly protein PilO